jgi:hypothetical protein
MIMTYQYEDILNRDWILTKWSTDLNQMATHEVRITAIIDGPDGHDWIVGEGWGLTATNGIYNLKASEFTMPLEHFRKQAVPMGGKEACKSFMNELVA